MKNLIEWFAITEDISDSDSKAMLEDIFASIFKTPIHYGDCTNENVACVLCTAENILNKYYDYTNGKDDGKYYGDVNIPFEPKEKYKIEVNVTKIEKKNFPPSI